MSHRVEENIDECEVEGIVDEVECLPGDHQSDEGERRISDCIKIFPCASLTQKEGNDSTPIERRDGKKVEDAQ
jgi:hypothetical protein